jgi:hypothetical protein
MIERFALSLNGATTAANPAMERGTAASIRAYGPMRRRSSSIRNAGGRSYWCRSRYSAISSSAFRVGPARTVAKNRHHTEKSPLLTAGASRDVEGASMALSREPHFRRLRRYRGLYLKDVMAVTKRRFPAEIRHSTSVRSPRPNAASSNLQP